jgi:prepilin-type N-terminal cleavage/methylation domain-containing protein
MKQVKQSFTLVEILVVIVIIGILSSFIFFTINDSVEKANIAKSKMFSESIRNNLLLNLVSEWKLDGNTNDSWGSSNGTWNGASSGTITSEAYLSESECVSGECIQFDGVDDYITVLSFYGTAFKGILNIGNYDGNATFSVWAKPSLLDTNNRFVFADNNINEGYVYFHSDAIIALWGGGSIVYSTTPQIDKWYNITLVHERNTETNYYYLDLYIDGEYIASANPSAINPDSTSYGPDSTLRIGSSWNGAIDEFKTFNEILTASEIKEKYSLEKNKYANR